MRTRTKVSLGATAVIVGAIVAGVASGGGNSPPAAHTTAAPSVTTSAPATATAAPAPKTSAPAPRHTSTVTVSEQQALESAQSYLAMGTGFSRLGLIRQLDSPDGEGFSKADATWGVDHAGADWNAQAVETAKGYMQMGGFSRASLIGQLTSDSEQFTYAQAEYAANKVGL
jgi:pyruvate/2-oxoglutarate dehydrogenase complex dihydrolipoamide acyltransferase (E2) component